MDIMNNNLQHELNEAQLELNTLSDVAESFFPSKSTSGTTRRRRSIDEDELHNRTRRLIGAVAALAVGTGFILGEHIKDAACNPLSIFNLCDSTEDFEQDLDQVTKQQETKQKAFQTVQDQNNGKLALLRDELRLIQESVEKSKKSLIHTFRICLTAYTLWRKRSDAINLKVPIVIFSNLHNFTCHKLAHCIHTLKHFVPHFTRIETISFQNSHLLPRDISHHNSYFAHNLPQSCKNWLLKNFGKVAN